jgi:hypothetical protein
MSERIHLAKLAIEVEKTFRNEENPKIKYHLRIAADAIRMAYNERESRRPSMFELVIDNFDTETRQEFERASKAMSAYLQAERRVKDGECFSATLLMHRGSGSEVVCTCECPKGAKKLGL